MPRYVLALDQGTTSSRAILFDSDSRPVAVSQREFPQIYPRAGEVEHDPEAIWESQSETAREVVRSANVDPTDIAAIGITNQRETVVVWERATGKPVTNAIVWQSRVSTPICKRLKGEGVEPLFRERTGLLLDPYFSGTKLTHLLESIDGLRERAERGEVLFGTVDCYLLWRLTGGRVHATDVTNASRTLMLDIHTLKWDDELLDILGVPRAMLPTVRPTCHTFGETDLLGPSIPVNALVGDQQAATFGQTCFDAGTAKNTYGTGCFLLMNTGESPVTNQEGLLTTIGWQLGDKAKPTYCLEGAVFIAGAVVQWLRDGLGVIDSAPASEPLANSVDDTDGVYLVPAFVGLGAPHWDPSARGLLIGLTRGTTSAHIARAALESMAFQTRDLIELMQKACGHQLPILRVDGGATENNLLVQLQADLLGSPVERPTVPETTALGAAFLAGLQAGVWSGLDDIRSTWQRDRLFEPQLSDVERESRYDRWRNAVERSRGWIEE